MAPREDTDYKGIHELYTALGMFGERESQKQTDSVGFVCMVQNNIWLSFLLIILGEKRAESWVVVFLCLD